MKRILIAAILASIIGVASARAQVDTNANLQADFDKMLTDFTHGPLTNAFAGSGVVYETKGKNRLGGTVFIGDNLPTMQIPLKPYVTPVLALMYVGRSCYGIDGTVALKADFHFLRWAAGTATNGVFYSAAFTPNIVAGVVQNISGEKFGSVTVPGNKPPNGTGTGALTGAGADIKIASIGGFQFALWGEYLSITTLEGNELEGGLALRKNF